VNYHSNNFSLHRLSLQQKVFCDVGIVGFSF